MPFQKPNPTLMARGKRSTQGCHKGLPQWHVRHVSDRQKGIIRLALQVPEFLCSAEMHFRFRCYRTPKIDWQFTSQWPPTTSSVYPSFSKPPDARPPTTWGLEAHSDDRCLSKCRHIDAQTLTTKRKSIAQSAFQQPARHAPMSGV